MELCCENEIESEGTINNIPKSINISNKFSSETKFNHRHLLEYGLDTNRKKFQAVLSKKDFKNEENVNRTLNIQNYKYNLKIEDNNSTASKSSINEDKIKKVTFSTVQIIRVPNYKRYNKLNTIKKNEDVSNSLDDKKCIIF